MKVKNIIKNISFYLFVGVIITYILFSMFASDRQTINLFYLKGLRVATPSMEPVLNVNDLAFIRKVNPNKLEEGDIITFETYVLEGTIFEKVVVTHYIGEIEEIDGVRYYKTQGHRHLGTNEYDANWVDENKNPIDITNDNIIGKYAFKIPFIGIVIVFFQNIFTNPILLILIIVNVLIIYVIVKLIKDGKKEQKEEIDNDLS